MQFGNSSAELAIEWLMTHPEEPGAAAAVATDTASKEEDEAVKKQLIASLGTDEVPKLEVGLPACSCLPVICNLYYLSVVLLTVPALLCCCCCCSVSPETSQLATTVTVVMLYM